MGTFTIPEAKTHLSRLIARAAAGEEIVILRGKTPVARLTAIKPKTSKRAFGAYRGELAILDTFLDPLPEVELRAFEGEGYDADPLGSSRAVAKGAPRHRRP